MNMAEKVARLRDTIDRVGLADSDDEWHALAAEGDPELIRHLLLMRAYDDDADHLHEMWEVIHTVEGYPDDVYYRELLEIAPHLSEKSPGLLLHLIGRIMNSDKYAPGFIDRLRQLSAAAPRCLRGPLKAIADDAERKPEARARAETALSCLGQPA